MTIDQFKLQLQTGNSKFESKSMIFLSRVTLTFDGWPWKTTGYLFYTTSSFVNHSIAIGQLKLELQCGNAKFGPKSAIFGPVWPRNLTDDLENNRPPLLCYFKLFTSFHSHRLIQAGVTVQKRQIRVKIGDFLSRVTLKFDGWPWKNNRPTLLCYFKLFTLFHSHRPILAGVTVRKRQIRVGSKSAIFCPVWPWNLTDDLEKQ